MHAELIFKPCRVYRIITGFIVLRLWPRAFPDIESEDKRGLKGTACENRHDVTSKDGMQLGATPFKDLQHRVLMESVNVSSIPVDGTLAFLRDGPKFCAAHKKLTVEADNKALDLITRQQIQGMLGLLNLHLDKGLHLT
jgi:hypothetical protein